MSINNNTKSEEYDIISEYYDIIDFNKYDNKKDFKKIYPDNDNDFIIVDHIQNNKMTTNRVFVNGIKTENIVYLDFSLWYNDIKKSFKNINDIYNQFILDNNRGDFYCNGNKIDDPYKLMDYLEYRYNLELSKKILLFCTQVSLAIPYEIILNKINLHMKKNIYYLGEISNKINVNRRYRINFTINDDNNVHFTIEKKLRIFRVIKGVDHTCCIVSILIDFFLNDKNLNFKFIYDPL